MWVSPDYLSGGGNGKCCMKVVSKCCAAVSSAVDTNFLFVLFLSLTSIGFPPSASLWCGPPNPSFSLHPFTCTSLSRRCAGWDRKKNKKFTPQASDHHLGTKQESFDFLTQLKPNKPVTSNSNLNIVYSITQYPSWNNNKKKNNKWMTWNRIYISLRHVFPM